MSKLYILKVEFNELFSNQVRTWMHIIIVQCLTLYHLRPILDLSKSHLLVALWWLGSACCARWID
jgi:hypothetical protein